jgi:hypothetical protein
MNPDVSFHMDPQQLNAMRAKLEELELSLGALNGLASRCYDDTLLLARQLGVLGDTAWRAGFGDHLAGFRSSVMLPPDDDEIPF